MKCLSSLIVPYECKCNILPFNFEMMNIIISLQLWANSINTIYHQWVSANKRGKRINICCGGIKEKYLMLSKSIQSFISEIWCLCKIIWYFFISTGHHHHSQSHYYYHPIKWCQAHVSYGQKIFGWNVIFYNLVGFCVDVYVVNNSTKFLSAA